MEEDKINRLEKICEKIKNTPDEIIEKCIDNLAIKQNIERLENLTQRCKECKFATCEQCEINWNDIQSIENVLAELEPIRKLGIPSKTLVAEFERLENIEDKWVQKIKAKIEELEKQIKEYQKESNYPRGMYVNLIIIEALEELLGE